MFLHFLPYSVVLFRVCAVFRHFPLVCLKAAVLCRLLPLLQYFLISGKSLRYHFGKLWLVLMIKHHFLGFCLKQFKQVLHHLKQIVGKHSRTVSLLKSSQHLPAPIHVNAVNLTSRSRKLCLLANLYRGVHVVLEEDVGRNLYVHVLHVQAYALAFCCLSVFCNDRLAVFFIFLFFLLIIQKRK